MLRFPRKHSWLFSRLKINMDISLYIHIPFCKSKCLYCDFCSFSGSENLMMDYSKTLSEEIKAIEGHKVKTIFIGGGTPTYLSLEGWELIGESIDSLNKSEDMEFSVEGNPGTFSYEKLKFLKDIGANRLSIGLQAAQNSLLKGIGRIHTFEEFLEAYSLARAVGFDNINVDLMFGLPNQSLKDWKETLNKVEELKPEHISAYGLIIEEGTELFDRFKQGRLALPEEDEERAMYGYTLEFLEQKEYNQYEISNFSKTGKECRHNLTYWNLEEYIGCGVSAHSYLEGKRFSHGNSIEGYMDCINNKVPQGLIHVNTIKDDMEEFMFMGLRKTEGISIEKFNKKFKNDIFLVYGSIINKYLEMGLLLRQDNMLKLSEKGIEISNTVMCEFIF